MCSGQRSWPGSFKVGHYHSEVIEEENKMNKIIFRDEIYVLNEEAKHNLKETFHTQLQEHIIEWDQEHQYSVILFPSQKWPTFISPYHINIQYSEQTRDENKRKSSIS